MLLTQLARGTFPVPAERVVIGPRIPHGMTGVESMLIYGRQLSNLSSGGAAGAGGAAGFDGSGLSGSAVSAGSGDDDGQRTKGRASSHDRIKSNCTNPEKPRLPCC